MLVDKVTEIVRRTIQEYHMLRPGDGVVVGVSGGPDSVCLLHVLNSLKNEYSINIYAAHLNHQLRGEEADKDEDYVRRLCGQLGIPFYCKRVDISSVAKKKGISEELAGREERYRYFFQVAEQVKADKIATAHNLNDQAETVLMHFIRGAGLEGLTGIPPVRKDGLIRPLIGVSRQMIEEYCNVHHLQPRIDATNLESTYTRNKLRLQLIPDIMQYNPNFIEHMGKTANMLREENDFFEQFVNGLFQENIHVVKGGVSISIGFLLSQHVSVCRRFIRKAIEFVKGNLIDIEYKHVDEMIKMISKKTTGLSMSLPEHIKVKVDYGFLKILKSVESEVEYPPYKYDLKIGETVYVKEVDAFFTAELVDVEQLKTIKFDQYTKAFDYDAVREGIYIRNRLPGDKFQPFGMKGTKKLKDYFIDEKVSRELRDKIPIIVTGNDIMWVVGYRTDERFKYTDQSKNILIIKVVGGLLK